MLFIHKIMEQNDDAVLRHPGVGYYEYLITSFDFILLVPFRLHRSSKNIITCRKNLLHQLICGSLWMCSFASCITELNVAINKNVYEDPVLLFGIAVKFTKIVYLAVFFNMFWRNAESVVHFANISSTDFPSGSKFFHLFLTCYPLMLDVLLFNQHKESVPYPGSESWDIILYWVYSVAGLLLSIMLTNFGDMQFFVFAYLGHSLIKRNIAELDHLKKWSMTGKKWNQGDFSCLVEMAQKIETFFEGLNSIGSCFVLNWFCMVVPWVSYKFVDSLPGTGMVYDSSSAAVIDLGYYWSYIGLYVVILIICAEIKRKCDHLKGTMKQIILQHDPNLIFGKAAFTHVEFALENVGVHGGYFFKFSYSFLGSAAGLVVAYVFLSLQLHLNCCTPANIKIQEPLNL